jgi:hypothetical protein
MRCTALCTRLHHILHIELNSILATLCAVDALWPRLDHYGIGVAFVCLIYYSQYTNEHVPEW